MFFWVTHTYICIFIYRYNYLYIYIYLHWYSSMYCNTFISNFTSLNADSPKANFTPASPKADVSELRDARLQAEEEVANGGTHNSAWVPYALHPRTIKGIHWDAGLNRYKRHLGSFRDDVRV